MFFLRPAFQQRYLAMVVMLGRLARRGQAGAAPGGEWHHAQRPAGVAHAVPQPVSSAAAASAAAASSPPPLLGALLHLITCIGAAHRLLPRSMGRSGAGGCGRCLAGYCSCSPMEFSKACLLASGITPSATPHLSWMQCRSSRHARARADTRRPPCHTAAVLCCTPGMRDHSYRTLVGVGCKFSFFWKIHQRSCLSSRVTAALPERLMMGLLISACYSTPF